LGVGHEPTIISIVGARGGVGKSIVATAMALGLARRGNAVVLIDADPGRGSLSDIFRAERPQATFLDVMAGREGSIEQALIPTPYEQLSLMVGDIGPHEARGPEFLDKFRLGAVRLPAEYVILELGSEATPVNLDLFNVGLSGIVVTTSETESLDAAYYYLKSSVIRLLSQALRGVPGMEQTIRVVFQAVEDDEEGFVGVIREMSPRLANQFLQVLSSTEYALVVNRDAGGRGDWKSLSLRGTADKSLGINLRTLGALPLLPDDGGPRLTIRDPVFAPSSDFMKAISKVLDNYLNRSHLFVVPDAARAKERRIDLPPLPMRVVRPDDPTELQMGFNEDVTFEDRVLHVQTEDLGDEKHQILTLVYTEGSILFSKTTDYSEIEADSGSFRRALRDRLVWQHRVIVAGVRSGKLKEKLVS
jgi:flagellar biosynthesis protein FlhG